MFGRERPNDVALGEDAPERLAVDDQRRPDVLDAHHLRRFGNRGVGEDRHEERAHHVSEGLHGGSSA
jgi:hypothetical protein